MINFKGHLALKSKVQELQHENCYRNISACLVELDKNSEDDYKVLKDIAETWKVGDLYANDVYERFKSNFENKTRTPEERFFVLTKQSKNFDKLNYTKILGVAELYKPEDSPLEIEFLQTNPKYIKTKVSPKIKHIGKAIVKGFLKIIKDKEIALFTTPNAKSFYEKLGFINIESNLMKLKR